MNNGNDLNIKRKINSNVYALYVNLTGQEKKMIKKVLENTSNFITGRSHVKVNLK